MNKKTTKRTWAETQTERMLTVTTQATRLKTKTDPKTRETVESDTAKPPLLVPAQPLPPCHQSVASHNSMQLPTHHQQRTVNSASASAQQAPAASSPTRS
ncbi:uncharacterized protein TrAtP1_005535 [Trichoderma atroviride]|uniref:Uncharacterized protein n=1 Tax=Hypocrea atroviridis (strain ATCC 20476 / IMI 206040) TaxID=452589 RepID=G9NSW8_HYPAI|nr:uncharacterized protein TRIATDRAFT_256473 [Trichoderma atroviride IMI 206040]EHK46513.1 hypothetical protein TRIATDRAFT_256473 [Trichoderma atroviride IMI 206040]UKZ64317.1 hypothetical protein TrAtP1_005535 [Trichoderma atroviride]